MTKKLVLVSVLALFVLAIPAFADPGHGRGWGHGRVWHPARYSGGVYIAGYWGPPAYPTAYAPYGYYWDGYAYVPAPPPPPPVVVVRPGYYYPRSGFSFGFSYRRR